MVTIVEVTIDETISTGAPGIEIVEVTASTTETLRSRRFGRINGCILGFNHPAAAYTDEKGTAAISGQSITLEMITSDVADVPMSIVLFGKTGRSI